MSGCGAGSLVQVQGQFISLNIFTNARLQENVAIEFI